MEKWLVLVFATAAAARVLLDENVQESQKPEIDTVRETDSTDVTIGSDGLNDTEVADGRANRFSPFMGRNSQYAVSAFVAVNWYTAQQICAFQGMTLANINSDSDAYNLKCFLEQSGFMRNGDSYWISGSDQAHHNNWFWFGSGRPHVYTNWNSGEPNNDEGNEHCLEYLPNHKWNDLNCDRRRYFICEQVCPLDSYSVPIYGYGTQSMAG